MATLELKHVTKRYKDKVVLDDLTLSVGDGETIVLFGPSGSGKTVLLRMIAGVVEPDEGRVLIGGERDILEHLVGLEGFGDGGEFEMMRHDQPFTAPSDRPSTR